MQNNAFICVCTSSDLGYWSLFLAAEMLQQTLVPSFFSLPAVIVLGLFTCNFMWFINLRAWAGMCWVCAGVCGSVLVCLGVHQCAPVCTGVCGCAWICAGVLRCAQVCVGVRGYVGGCVGVFRCTGMHRCMCGMNFQNAYWRLES